MNLLLDLYILIQAGLLYLAINAICFTLRFNRDGPVKVRAAQEGKNCLFAVWHRETFVMFFLYRRRRAAILVSSEARGRILGQCARWLGYETIPTPTGDDKLAAARSAARLIKLLKSGHDAVIAVDGPIGPSHEVKPGVHYIAEKAGVSIVPIGVVAPFKLTLFWRWDKYFVPLPFSPVKIQVGKPVRPGAKAALALKQELLRLSQR
ncbi:MAG: DUF374 domain-containing protein [Desulfobaccales bacterium]